eukprot:14285594-Alexandrium_andersonii.AAC.1
MSASLVGSEMCIRDRHMAIEGHQKVTQGQQGVSTVLPEVVRESHRPQAVSYTHLTLPTICSV